MGNNYEDKEMVNVNDMETKYHVDDDDDERGHIIESQQFELNMFFKKNRLSKFKSNLSQLTIDVLSEHRTKRDHRKLIKKLKYLVNIGWELVFQNHRYGLRYDVESKDFVNNPLYLKEAFQSQEFRQRNFGLSGFYGDITYLSIDDASNIYKVLKDFFNEISVISWLKLLDDWYNILDDEDLDWRYHCDDYNPLKTQIFLNRLIESLYLFSVPDFLGSAVNTPTTHLLNNRISYQDMDVDSLEMFNPYFWLAHIFYQKSVKDYISDLHKLHKLIPKDEAELFSNQEYYNIGKSLRVLIQTVWLNIQCEILPKEWTEVFKVEREADTLNNLEAEMKNFVNELSLDHPTNLENLIFKLFGKEWKILAYEKAIDLMVEQKVCDRNRSFHFYMCDINDLELVIKTSYLMLLDMKQKKATGQLMDVDCL